MPAPKPDPESPQRPPQKRLHQHVAVLAWRALALVCFALALIGVLLPGLPTVPFLLLAAWAGGRGWPQLEAWLLAHTHFGPPIRRWRASGAVPRRAKWFASVMMLLSAGLIALSSAPLAIQLGVPGVVLVVAIWLWRRPES